MIEENKSFLNIESKYLTYFLIILLFILSSLFFFKAFINSTVIGGSVDLNPIYHLSKNFWCGEDIFFNIRPGFSHMPVWNHIIYIIFYPFTLFSFEVTKVLWFCSNLFFTFITIKVLKKAYDLDLNRSLILTILVVSSTPFTNTLGNGQLGLFLLMSLTIYWYSKSKFKVVFLSSAYIKFSFAPFFLINSLFKKEKDLIYAMILSFFAVIFFGIYINDLRLVEFFNPLLAILAVIESNSETFRGDGNNFHIRAFFYSIGLFKYYIWGMIFFGILNLVNIFYIKKNNHLLFIIISISSLFIFYHNYYDLVFLIPLACYLLKKNISKHLIIVNLPIILFFFYFVRFNELILNSFFSQDFINIFGSILLLISYMSLTLENIINRNSV